MQQQRHYERFSDRGKGKVALDGKFVHILHPDDPTQVLKIPHPTDAAAVATFKKVCKEYFGPNAFKETFRSENVDVDAWLPKPLSPEEQEKALRITRRRELGYDVAGETLVISLKRQKNKGDLEILFERVTKIRALHVLLSVDDMDGVGRTSLFQKLVDAFPTLVELTLESPSEPRAELASITINLPPELLETAVKLERFAVQGILTWPAKLPPKLQHLRVNDPKLTAPIMSRMIDHPTLRTLQLVMPDKAEPTIRRALERAPLEQLDELTLVGVEDADAMRAAIKKPPRTLEINPTPSPFDAETRPAELRALWEGLE